MDFHTAFHIGHLSAQDPTAFFHIISQDTGFDPPIQHLKNQNIFASRSKDVRDIPLLKAANSKSVTEKIDVVVVNLQQRGASMPRMLKTPTSTINSLFQRQLSEADLSALLKALQAKGFIAVNETKVTYSLPACEAYPLDRAERQRRVARAAIDIANRRDTPPGRGDESAGYIDSQGIPDDLEDFAGYSGFSEDSSCESR